MATVHSYLTFDGNCEEAFTFYKSVFGGEFSYLGRFKDMPPMEGCDPVSESDGEKIMHISIPIGTGSHLMGCDSLESFGRATIIGNNFSLSLNAESREEADNLFGALSEGGQIGMAMDKTFWGAYFGMLTDKFGIQWMINFDENENIAS
jgi:PhnB protein